jgi:opacity protein-like surface antigen
MEIIFEEVSSTFALVKLKNHCKNMKKISVVLSALLLSGSSAMGQERSAGNATIEVGCAPFAESPFHLIRGLRGRYFLSNKVALRKGLGMSYESSSKHTTVSDVEQVEKNSLFSFTSALGGEYHFAACERASLYAGAGAELGLMKASQKITNAGHAHGDYVSVSGRSALGSSRLSFGLQAFTGIDAYVYKSVYLGAELGLQYSLQKPSEVTTTQNIAGYSATATSKDYTQETALGLYVLPAFRLGWRF